MSITAQRSCAVCRLQRPTPEFQLGFASWSASCAACRAKVAADKRVAGERLARQVQATRERRAAKAKAKTQTSAAKLRGGLSARLRPCVESTPTVPPPLLPRPPQCFSDRPGAMDALRLPSHGMTGKSWGQ